MVRRPHFARPSRAASASTLIASSAAPAPTSLISLIAHAYLGPGDEAIFTEHGFLLYRIVVLAAGATPVVAPETRATEPTSTPSSPR